MRTLQGLLCLSMVASLAGLPAHAADPTPATPVLDVVDAGALQGVRRVAVASFTVQYVTAQVWDTSYTSGGGRSGTLQTAGQGGGFDVAGALEPSRMQATTDQLYAAFQTELQRAGLEVVPPEQLAASKAYKAMVSASPSTPRKEEAQAQKSNGAGAITSVFYTPPGVPLVLGEKFDHLSTGTFGSSVPDPTLTFTGRLSLYTTNWSAYDRDLQRELDAATLHVRLYVPLAHVQVASSSFWGSGYSRQGIVPGLRLGERLTRVTVGHRGDYAKLFLSEPLLIPGPIDSTVEEVKHPNFARAMLGEKIKIYPGTIAPELYWERLPQSASQALGAFAVRIRTGSGS